MMQQEFGDVIHSWVSRCIGWHEKVSGEELARRILEKDGTNPWSKKWASMARLVSTVYNGTCGVGYEYTQQATNDLIASIPPGTIHWELV